MSEDPHGDWINSRIEALKHQGISAKYEELVKLLNEADIRPGGHWEEPDTFLVAGGIAIEWHGDRDKWILTE